MLKVLNLVKTYKSKNADTVYALNDVSIEFPETGLVFLLGKSGSGKSTLLNAIGGLDTFDSGEIIIKGKSSKKFSQSDFDSYRNTFIGFIFQEYNILENFTVAKNLALALELQGKKARKEEVNALLEQVDMQAYANRKPNQLSGGQKQRVAIARALIKNPEIIMADEPTGALDSATGKQVMDTLKKLSATKLVIIVSHDREFAEIYGDRIIELKDGKILHDITKKEIEAKQSESGIKMIGDDLIYIKKGQQISGADILHLTSLIKKGTTDNDLFISFDKDANQKLKEGAKINDSGNKETFVDTQPQDIKSKQYNGNDLKLIRSHLKFSDSFKMGASSLKTKVGKLIFTLLLSFFAFTVFGLVDTFSTWNRANSVYEGIKYDSQKIVLLKKQQKEEGSTYPRDMNFNSIDISELKQKFPDYTFKPAAGNGYFYGSNMAVVGKELTSQVNDIWQFGATKYVNFTSADLRASGLKIEGRLPANDTEIAITRHLFNVLKKTLKDTTLTSYSGLKLTINYFYDDTRTNLVKFDVVGIVEDNSDFSEFENYDDNEIRENYKISNAINIAITSGISNWVFVSSANVERLNDANNSTRVYMSATDGDYRQNVYGDDVTTAFNAWADETVATSSYNNTYETLKTSYIEYFKGGTDKIIGADGKFVTIANNEVLVSKYVLNGKVSDYETKIDEGTLYVKLYSDSYGGSELSTYKVVGILKDSASSNIMGGQLFVDNYKVYASMINYRSIFTILKGTDKDADLIKYCETFTSDSTRFAVVNKATDVFDTFEDIISNASRIFLYIAIAFAVFASLLLMNFISTSISYKKREIGVLRALGARGSDIFGIFFNESTIIAFINFFLASVATFVGSMIINRVIIKAIGVSVVLLSFGIRQILLLLAICWGSAFLSSLIPSIKISKKRPIDAINNR